MYLVQCQFHDPEFASLKLAHKGSLVQTPQEAIDKVRDFINLYSDKTFPESILEETLKNHLGNQGVGSGDFMHVRYSVELVTWGQEINLF